MLCKGYSQLWKREYENSGSVVSLRDGQSPESSCWAQGRLLDSCEAILHESVKEALGEDRHDRNGHAFFCPQARAPVMKESP